MTYPLGRCYANALMWATLHGGEVVHGTHYDKTTRTMRVRFIDPTFGINAPRVAVDDGVPTARKDLHVFVSEPHVDHRYSVDEVWTLRAKHKHVGPFDRKRRTVVVSAS
jgi:hypothetical protein